MKIPSVNRTIWFDRTLFPSYIGFTPSKKAWRHTMRSMNCETDYPNTDGSCTEFTKDNKHCVLITVGDTTETSEDAVMGILVHECVHAAQYLFENMGETRPSPEFEAYTIQWLFAKTLDAYAKTRHTCSKS